MLERGNRRVFDNVDVVHQSLLSYYLAIFQLNNEILCFCNKKVVTVNHTEQLVFQQQIFIEIGFVLLIITSIHFWLLLFYFTGERVALVPLTAVGAVHQLQDAKEAGPRQLGVTGDDEVTAPQSLLYPNLEVLVLHPLSVKVLLKN